MDLHHHYLRSSRHWDGSTKLQNKSARNVYLEVGMMGYWWDILHPTGVCCTKWNASVARCCKDTLPNLPINSTLRLKLELLLRDERWANDAAVDLVPHGWVAAVAGLQAASLVVLQLAPWVWPLILLGEQWQEARSPQDVLGLDPPELVGLGPALAVGDPHWYPASYSPKLVAPQVVVDVVPRVVQLQHWNWRWASAPQLEPVQEQPGLQPELQLVRLGLRLDGPHGWTRFGRCSAELLGPDLRCAEHLLHWSDQSHWRQSWDAGIENQRVSTTHQPRCCFERSR